jgi:hypothetical protein
MSVRGMLVISHTTPHFWRWCYETSETDNQVTIRRIPEEHISHTQRRVNLMTRIWNAFKKNSKIFKHDMHSPACILMESSECDKDLIVKMERWHISQILLILQKEDFVEHVNNFQNPYKILRFLTNPHNTG